jgi:NADH:ubiquinone oxidoreductase subunit 3 (subunit A)
VLGLEPKEDRNYLFVKVKHIVMCQILTLNKIRKNLLLVNIIFFSFSSIFFFFFMLGVFFVFWKKGKNFFKNREKGRPFECGFDPKFKARLPFSLRFFILLLFFLIFDIEIILLLQLPLLFELTFFKISLFILNFLWILLLGFLEEWRRGALKWKS